MLLLKIDQLFGNLSIIDLLRSPYAGIMLEFCTYSGIIMQHDVKLAADKGKDDEQSQQRKAANRESKRG